MCPSRSSSLGPSGNSLPAHRTCRRAATVHPTQQTAADEADLRAFCEARACYRRGSIRERVRSQVFERLSSGDVMDRLDVGQTGGVYTVRDECPQDAKDSPPMAVFKSEGEEGFARRGILPGCGAVREEAAYLLDRLTGSVAGVPVTLRTAVPVGVLGRKLEDAAGRKELERHSPAARGGLVSGAVQSFVPGVLGAAEDFGMPRDLTSAARVVSTAAAQQIACLDVRLCNTDRHGGNLLFQYGQHGDIHPSASAADGIYRPVPIDHGCTLPRWWAMGEANFEAWADWPQVHAPCLPEVLDIIEAAVERREEAVRMLAELGLEPAAQATYYIAVSLLYEGTVRHGLSLACVAGLLSRNAINPGEPSWLEARMVELASDVGMALGWVEDSYGDRVPAAPEDEDAWPPKEFLNRLLALFASAETKAAGLAWREEWG